MTRPWLRLDASMHSDAKIRIAQAGAVWPWVLCQMKRCGGRLTDDDLMPGLAALDCSITAEQAAAQLDGLKRVELLVKGDGWWTTPMWDVYQPKTGAQRMREHRARKAEGRDEIASPSVTERHESSPRVTSRHRVTDVARVTADGTGRDGTGQTNSSANADSPELPLGDGVEPQPPEPKAKRVDPEREAVLEVIAYWAEESGGRVAQKMDVTTKTGKKRYRSVRAMIREGLTVGQLKYAVDGALSNPFLVTNGHTDIISICVDASRVERHGRRAAGDLG